jgi:hypothetical protein
VNDPGEPEDTVPFTHRPYGARGDDNPFVSPSGPAAEPSGPSYTAPLPPPPPGVGPVPYGPPTGGQEPWQTAWAPVYGAPAAGSLEHQGARQAMVYGIIALSCLFVSLFCCVAIPGVFCAPVAWVKGSRAKREIDRVPGVYGNRGQAQAAVVMGIIGSIAGVLVALVLVGFAILIGSGWSLV